MAGCFVKKNAGGAGGPEKRQTRMVVDLDMLRLCSTVENVQMLFDIFSTTDD